MEIYKKIIDLKTKNKSFVVAMVVHTEGSAPGKVGFKMIVESNGETYGTVGGGALEKHVVEEALKRLQYGGSGIQEYVLSDKVTEADEPAKVIPMMCAGKVMLYYGVHGQLPAVYIFGGGHVGCALVHHLSPLKYHLLVVDNRENYAEKLEKSSVNEFTIADYLSYAQQFKPLDDAYVLIMTQGHSFDYGILKILYDRKLNLKYIGVIASKAKAQNMITKLKEELGEELDISNLRTPVGLTIGGDTAHDIALSIAAEMQAIRYGKS